MLNSRKAEQAAEVMGVSLEGLTSKILGEQYKSLVRIHHPDVGGDTEKFIAIQKAKTDLVFWLDQLNDTGPEASITQCVYCKGKGYVHVTRGFTSMNIKCLHCESKDKS